MLLLFKLLIGHALADYPLQGDFLARGKNHKNPIPRVPWYWCLGAHSLIQAGMVLFITGAWELASGEFFLHFLIDYLKSDGDFGEKYAFDIDQIAHIICKIIWCSLYFLIP